MALEFGDVLGLILTLTGFGGCPGCASRKEELLGYPTSK